MADSKKGVFIIELLVIVIACVIVLKGPKRGHILWKCLHKEIPHLLSALWFRHCFPYTELLPDMDTPDIPLHKRWYGR